MSQKLLWLAGGTALSHFLLFGAMLTSLVLYTPEQVGHYGLILSSVYAFSHFSGLRADGLLVAAPEEQSIWLGFAVRVHQVQTLVLLIVLYLWTEEPVSALLGALVFYLYSDMLVHTVVHLQHQRIPYVTLTKVTAAGTTWAGQVLFFFSPLGLLAGDLLGKLLHASLMRKHIDRTPSNWRRVMPQMKKEKRALTYLNVMTLGTVASFYGPILVVEWAFGLEFAAYYFLVQRMMGFVEQIVGYSSHQLMIARVSLNHSFSRLQWFQQVLLAGGFSLGLIAIVACLTHLSSFSKWQVLVPLLIAYVPVGVMQSVLSPVRTYLLKHQEWRLLCIGEVGRGVGVLILSLLAKKLPFETWVYLVSGGGAVVFLVVLIFYLSRCKVHSRSISSSSSALE